MSKEKSKYKFIIGIAAAMLVPLFCYMLVVLFSKDKITLPPHYIADSVDSSMKDGRWQFDTSFHQTHDITLINQLGKTVSLNTDLKGKMLVIDFIFTNCSSSCPTLTKNMKLLQNAYRRTEMRQNDTMVQFISITVNPERDSFPALRAYADRYDVNHDRWWFLTGDKKQIYDYARNELGLSTGPGDGGADDFLHTEKFVLLDKDRYIRGYYDGTNGDDVKRCANDVGWLALEKKKKK